MEPRLIGTLFQIHDFCNKTLVKAALMTTFYFKESFVATDPQRIICNSGVHLSSVELYGLL